MSYITLRTEWRLGAKGYALSIFIDIEGAFNSTSKSIKEVMTKCEIPETLVDWTKNIVTNRNLLVLARFRLGGRLANVRRRVLYPLLSCLVIDELLIKLRETDFLVFGYADDVAIVARKNFLSILKEHMDDALRIIQNWCRNKGLMINSSKTTIMIFTRKYKPKAIESLKLWGKKLIYANFVKYLEVNLDTKLS